MILEVWDDETHCSSLTISTGRFSPILERFSCLLQVLLLLLLCWGPLSAVLDGFWSDDVGIRQNNGLKHALLRLLKERSHHIAMFMSQLSCQPKRSQRTLGDAGLHALDTNKPLSCYSPTQMADGNLRATTCSTLPPTNMC